MFTPVWTRARDLDRQLEAFHAGVRDFKEMVDQLHGTHGAQPKAQIQGAPTAAKLAPSLIKSGSMRHDDAARLPPGERAILIAAAQFQAVGRDQLSVLTGYKRSSRDAYIARLKDKGYLVVNDDALYPTPEGIAALGSDYEPLPHGPELIAYWKDKLPEGERRIFEALVAAWPREVARTKLDEITGYKRSSRDAYLSRMKSRRLVVFLSRGEVKAADELFM